MISAGAVAAMVGDWSGGGGPAHARLAVRLRLLILDGRLPLDLAVPGERVLAAALGVSRTTVTSAYIALRDQGFLTGTERAHARTTLPGTHGPVAVEPDPGRVPVDFAHAAPAAPEGALHAAYGAALAELPRYFPRHGYVGPGVAPLREAVAARYTARGLPTRPDQILVTNGAQHALGLVVRTLLRARDRVVVDHPTYPHALNTLRAAYCRILPVALGTDGWDIPTLRTATRGADLAFLLPDFHNPTGALMADADRERLDPGCPVVVDETMAELALDTAPGTPLPAFARDVIAIGSASKTFWGGLRVGWIRAKPALLHQIQQQRPTVDLGTPVVEQLATAHLLDRIGAILPDRLDTLRRRRAHLRARLRDRLPDWSPRPAAGGLALWNRLPRPISSTIAAYSADHGVLVAAGPRFGIGGAFERHLRIPYTLDEADITAGVDALAACLARLTPATPTRQPSSAVV